jgi:hypothetical protein
MRKIVLIIILVFSSSLFAQLPIKTGTINISGILSYMNQETLDPDHNKSILLLSPQVGYFIFDNLSLNLSVDYSYESSVSDIYASNYNSTDFGIGPSFRYYFDLNQVKPFLSLGYLFTKKIISNGNSKEYPGQQLAIIGGIDYFITNDIALETNISYRIVVASEPTYPIDGEHSSYKNYNTFLIGVGINIFL